MTNNSTTTIFLFILMAVAFYFLMIRPQRKRQRRQQETIASLVPGSRVMLSSGIYATLVEMRSADADVELAPGVVITVVRQAVAQAAPMTEEDVLGDSDAQASEDLDPEAFSAESFSAENLRPEDFRDDADDPRQFGAVQPRSSSQETGGSQEDYAASHEDVDAVHESHESFDAETGFDAAEPASDDAPAYDDDRRPEGN